MRIGGVICDCILSAFNAIIVVLVEAVFLMNYIKKNCREFVLFSFILIKHFIV